MLNVAIIGAPNVGKSSILNALVGENVSIVTDLAGTTRDQIRGFVPIENPNPIGAQQTGDSACLIDTPGMLRGATLLDKHMRKSISAAVASADVLLFVLDATRFDHAEIQKIENYRAKSILIPVVVAVNKIDRTKPDKLFPQLESLKSLDFVHAIVPVSAKAGQNLDTLRNALISAGVCRSEVNSEKIIFPPEADTFTDQTVRQMSAEIIRAAVIKSTRAEIPHGVAVVITKFHEGATEVEICADIICQKSTHKPIIIGAGGANLKRIGIMARREIEKLLDAHVRLLNTVVVRPNWKNNNDIINSPFV